MTFREKVVCLISGLVTLAVLITCAVWGMRDSPGGAEPAYKAIFGPGGSYYFRDDGTRVTDPGEERQAGEQIRRILSLPGQ